MFAIPVTLAYKGEKVFSTLLGGICSFILVLLLVGIFTVQLYDLIAKPTFRATSTIEYISFDEKAKDLEFDMYTTNNTVAAAIFTSREDPASLDFRVQFLQYEVPTFIDHKAENAEKNYIPAVLCKDFYAEQIK